MPRKSQPTPAPGTFVPHMIPAPASPSPPSSSSGRHTRPTAAEVAASAAKPGRNYPCSDCGKAFTTSGHLARHAKTHTGERSHKCPFPGCTTACSRQDNLQQHYRVHLSPGSKRASHDENRRAMRARAADTDSEDGETPPPKRRRAGPSAPAGAVFYTELASPPRPPSPPLTPPPIAEADMEILTGARLPRALPNGSLPVPIYNSRPLDCDGAHCAPRQHSYGFFVPHVSEPSLVSPTSTAPLSPLLVRPYTPLSRQSTAYSLQDGAYSLPSEASRPPSSAGSWSSGSQPAPPAASEPPRLAGPACPGFTAPRTVVGLAPGRNGLPGMDALVASLPSRAPRAPVATAPVAEPTPKAPTAPVALGPFPGGGVAITAAYARTPHATPAPSRAPSTRPALPFPAYALTRPPSPSRVLPPLPDLPAGERGLLSLARMTTWTDKR